MRGRRGTFNVRRGESTSSVGAGGRALCLRKEVSPCAGRFIRRVKTCPKDSSVPLSSRGSPWSSKATAISCQSSACRYSLAMGSTSDSSVLMCWHCGRANAASASSNAGSSAACACRSPLKTWAPSRCWPSSASSSGALCGARSAGERTGSALPSGDEGVLEMPRCIRWPRWPIICALSVWPLAMHSPVCAAWRSAPRPENGGRHGSHSARAPARPPRSWTRHAR
jgi:hypothetical protein